MKSISIKNSLYNPLIIIFYLSLSLINTVALVGTSVSESGFRMRRLEHNNMKIAGNDLFQELVDSLCSLLFVPTQPVTIPSLRHHSHLRINITLLVQWSHLCPTAVDCYSIHLQCTLFLEVQPQLFPTEGAKIGFFSLLNASHYHTISWTNSDMMSRGNKVFSSPSMRQAVISVMSVKTTGTPGTS